MFSIQIDVACRYNYIESQTISFLFSEKNKKNSEFTPDIFVNESSLDNAVFYEIFFYTSLFPSHFSLPFCVSLISIFNEILAPDFLYYYFFIFLRWKILNYSRLLSCQISKREISVADRRKIPRKTILRYFSTSTCSKTSWYSIFCVDLTTNSINVFQRLCKFKLHLQRFWLDSQPVEQILRPEILLGVWDVKIVKI